MLERTTRAASTARRGQRGLASFSVTVLAAPDGVVGRTVSARRRVDDARRRRRSALLTRTRSVCTGAVERVR